MKEINESSVFYTPKENVADGADSIMREQIAQPEKEEFEQLLKVNSDSTKDSDDDCFSKPISVEEVGIFLIRAGSGLLDK